MQGFDWDQFSNGVWYVTQKFATRSTTALQRKGWAGPRVQVHRQAVRCQRGSACQDERPLPSQPDWRGQLRGVGHRLPSYALICTCQEIDLFITTGHRRSCSILQRAVEEDEAITDKLIELLDSQVPDSSHDFDPIKQ